MIRKGDKTVENDVFFTNVQMRLGLAYDLEHASFQAGVEVRSYAYRLKQRDRIQDTKRHQNESWMEWSPSFGARAKFSEFEDRLPGAADHRVRPAGRTVDGGASRRGTDGSRLHHRTQRPVDATGCARDHPSGHRLGADPVKRTLVAQAAHLEDRQPDDV